MIKYCEFEVVRYCINELLKRVGLVMLVVVTHKDSQGIGLTQKAPYAHPRVARGATCAPLRATVKVLDS